MCPCCYYAKWVEARLAEDAQDDDAKLDLLLRSGYSYDKDMYIMFLQQQIEEKGIEPDPELVEHFATAHFATEEERRTLVLLSTRIKGFL